MDLKDKKKYISLYDYYGKLLTTKQQEYFSYYFFEDYSLSEIADLKHVSRAAISDAIYKIAAAFNKMESILLLSKKQLIREQIYFKYKVKFPQIISELKKIDEL